MIKQKVIFALSVILFFLCLVIGAKGASFAQGHSASRIERSQEILEKEEALREKIEKEEKVYIKKIILKGITSLSKEQREKIISPFQARWLTKKDIQQILELLKEAYHQQGYPGLPASISYQIKRNNLLIKAEEKPADSK